MIIADGQPIDTMYGVPEETRILEIVHPPSGPYNFDGLVFPHIEEIRVEQDSRWASVFRSNGDFFASFPNLRRINALIIAKRVYVPKEITHCKLALNCKRHNIPGRKQGNILYTLHR